MGRQITLTASVPSQILDKMAYLNMCTCSEITPYEVIERKTPNVWLVRKMKWTEREATEEELYLSFVNDVFVGHSDYYSKRYDIESDPDQPIERANRARSRNKVEFHLHGSRDGCPMFPSDEPQRFKDSDFQ